MPAWGVESFSNDDAMEWLSELENAEDAEPLWAALRAVTDESADELEASTCVIALAAAETVAALNGHPSPTLPEELTRWVARHRMNVDPALTGLALNAVEAVQTSSELKDRWEDSGSLEEWQVDLDSLRARLR